jgi:hypothetical protein
LKEKESPIAFKCALIRSTVECPTSGNDRSTLAAAILIFLPDCGLQPVRAGRATSLNLPKPAKETGLPFFTAVTMVSVTVSSRALRAGLP